MQRKMFVVLAIVVVASLVSTAALALTRPMAHEEFVIHDLGQFRTDMFSWVTGQETENDWASLATRAGFAWVQGWKLGGVDNGIPDFFAPATQNNNFYVINDQASAAMDTMSGAGTLASPDSLINTKTSKGMDVSVRGDYAYLLNSSDGYGANAYVTRYGRMTGGIDLSFGNGTGTDEGKLILDSSIAAQNIAVTADGSIYIAGAGTNGVQKYSADGTLVGTVAAGIGNTFGLREDWAGRLWVTRNSADFGAFGVIDTATGLYSEMFNSGDADISQFAGLGFTSDGLRVLVVSQTHSWVYRHATYNGASLGGFRVLDQPYGTDVAMGPNIFTTFNMDGTFTRTAQVGPDVPEPGSLLALGSGLMGLLGFTIRRRK